MLQGMCKDRAESQNHSVYLDRDEAHTFSMWEPQSDCYSVKYFAAFHSEQSCASQEETES